MTKIVLFLLCTACLIGNLERRSSYPYFTGDTWRHFCDWRLTETEDFDPAKVRRGDTIFVEYQLLKRFRKSVRQIKHPFILITPNVEGASDGPLPGPFVKLLRQKNLAAWFLQNADCPASDRIIPIPIGLSNTFWARGNLKEVQERARDIFVYVNFNPQTNIRERKPCFDYFSAMPCAQMSPLKSFQEFLIDLSRSVFVVSPPGNGLDCHRTWEALYMKCYPIVLSSTLNPLYENLPVVIVDRWEEATEELLQAKLQEFRSRNWDYDKLYIPYWFERVRAIQKKLRASLIERVMRDCKLTYKQSGSTKIRYVVK